MIDVISFKLVGSVNGEIYGWRVYQHFRNGNGSVIYENIIFHFRETDIFQLIEVKICRKAFRRSEADELSVIDDKMWLSYNRLANEPVIAVEGREHGHLARQPPAQVVTYYEVLAEVIEGGKCLIDINIFNIKACLCNKSAILLPAQHQLSIKYSIKTIGINLVKGYHIGPVC